MIRVQALSKNFSNIQAVDQVSFDASRGEVLGFLGPNGAGKSTTMKMLTCFIPPSSGTADICGFSILENPLQARAQIGYLPESAPSYDEMLVGEFLRFVGEVRGYSGKELHRRVSIVIEMTAPRRKDLADVKPRGRKEVRRTRVRCFLRIVVVVVMAVVVMVERRRWPVSRRRARWGSLLHRLRRLRRRPHRRCSPRRPSNQKLFVMYTYKYYYMLVAIII